MYTYPQVYDFNFPSKFKDENPHLVQVVNHDHIKQSPWKNKVTLTSKAGQSFTSFAKFTKFDAGNAL